MTKTLLFIVKFLLVLGFTMWAFISIVPEERTEEKNYVIVYDDYEIKDVYRTGN